MPVPRRRFLAAAAWAAFGHPAVRAAAPDPVQQRIAESFAGQCVGSRIIYDDFGNVVKLAISRHTGRNDTDVSKLPPGVSDAEFPDILLLPKLEAVFIEKMPLSDDSYALLGKLRHLTDVRIHYPVWARTQTPQGQHIRITDRFGQCVNQLPGLKVLQFKHIFRLDGDGIRGLRPQPELEHLEIDTICAKSTAIPFIGAAARLRNLQVHRSRWTDAELQTVLASLPELEVLELKPDRVPTDSIGGHSLRGLQKCPKLRLLQLTGQMAGMDDRSSLDALTTLPALQQLNLILKDITINSPAVQRLVQARPDLLVRINDRTYGGQPEQKPCHVDDGYDWGGTVTTHG